MPWRASLLGEVMLFFPELLQIFSECATCRLEFNPRLGQLDIKMFLYLTGAVMLGANLLSGLLYASSTGELHVFSGYSIYTALFFYFLAEYMWHEDGKYACVQKSVNVPSHSYRFC